MTTALLMAVVLAMAQADATPPASAAPPPATPSVSVVVPTAQAVTPPPSPAQAAPPPATLSASVVVPTAQPAPPPAPASAVVSTAPQSDLDSAPTVRPFEMPAAAAAPSGPVPYAAADAPAKTPVKVEAYHRDYEGPQDTEEAYYEAGVRSAFEAEQALRGRLEGMWIVSAADGAPLLSLVISDPGRPDAPPGGAWRDLSRAHDPDASGVIDQVVEEGVSVIVQIRLKAGAGPTTLRLTPSADGHWRGLLLDGGAPKPVVMDRKAI